MLHIVSGLMVAFSPLFLVTLLLTLATARERRRAHAVARQIALTDAIAGELGAVVAPVVSRSWRGPWRVAMAVPMNRPAVVARVLGIAHRLFAGGEPYRIELVEQEASPARPGDAGALIELPVRGVKAA